jgi:hypothetical protein
MVAADKFDFVRRNFTMRIGGGNLKVVVDLNAVLFPRARLGNDMQEDKVAGGPVREGYFIHRVSRPNILRRAKFMQSAFSIFEIDYDFALEDPDCPLPGNSGY